MALITTQLVLKLESVHTSRRTFLVPENGTYRPRRREGLGLNPEWERTAQPKFADIVDQRQGGRDNTATTGSAASAHHTHEEKLVRYVHVHVC